jgi:hypothetical protein
VTEKSVRTYLKGGITDMAKPYWNLFKTQDQRPWPNVGVAFMNKDGSYNLKLRQDIKATEKLQMREGRQKGKSQA